jgi:hypothetical protein
MPSQALAGSAAASLCFLRERSFFGSRVSGLMESRRMLYFFGFTQFPSRQMNSFGWKLL